MKKYNPIYMLIILASLSALMFFAAVPSTEAEAPSASTLTITETSTPTATPTPNTTPKPTTKSTVAPTSVRKTAEIKQVKPTKTPDSAQSMPCADSDLDLLSRLVYAEAGSDWCSDEMQLLVANVVINRMNDSRFPDTLRGVIYQRGQYACAGKLDGVKPSARAVKNAKRVLEGERFAPAKVVYQSEFQQGRGLWKKVGNQFFCF